MPRLVVLAAVTLLCAGCSLAPRPDPSRFYTLTATAGGDAGAEAPLTRVVVGVGPITLPAYLERPEIVTRVAPNQVVFSDVERWAEPLRRNVAAVLVADLAVLLRPDQVLAFPWFGAPAADYTVEVVVRRLERSAEGDVHLHAAWVLREGRRLERVDGGDTVLREAVAAGNTEAAAAALSRMLETLSRDVATAIRRVHAGRGARPGGGTR
jgi:uncharacterized lipoprotein YmbA